MIHDQGAVRSHATSVAFGRLPPDEVDAGTDIALTVQVSCPDGCDLRGLIVNVVAPDGAVAIGGELGDFADRANETTELVFTAPREVGAYSWTVVFPRHDDEGLVHEESTLPIAVKTRAHDTSLAVWGVPSPIVIDHSFRVHVGATCSAGCDLTDEVVQIDDETGACLARGTLGETPWEGTRALYWTEIDLVAASKEGATSRSVRFAPTELRLPHDGASARFGFETVRPPQHSVTVRVLHKDAGTPVEDAQVRLGVYLAYSNPTGLATVAVPRGSYSLDVLKTGYETLSQVVDVNGDVAMDAEVVVIPPENPDAYWLFDPTKRV
jgi:hypothetical protein